MMPMSHRWMSDRSDWFDKLLGTALSKRAKRIHRHRRSLPGQRESERVITKGYLGNETSWYFGRP
jgi:hypothetical protein